MPIYEYRCGGCGFKKEYLQKLSDPPITACPSCGKPQMVKLVSAAGFQLKGTGWYATDFKTARKAPAADSKAPAADNKGSGADAPGKGEASGGGDAKDGSKTDAAAAPSCGAGACSACR